MKKIHIISLLLLLVWTSSSQAQDTYRFSLQQCIDYAVANHKNILNGRIDELSAQQKVREYLSAAYPQIDGQVQFQHFLEIPTSLIPAAAFGGPPGEFIAVQFGTTNNATAGIGVRQLIFDGLFFVGLKATKEYVELTKLNTARSEVETAAAVSKAYYSVLVAETGRQLFTTSIQQTQKALEDTRILQQNGLAEAIDVDRITVNLNNLQTEQTNIARQAELARYLLKFQMGMPQSAELILTDNVNPADFNPIAFAADEPVRLERLPEYKVLKKSIELQDINIKRYKVGALPSLYFNGGLQAQAFRNEFNFFDTKKRWFPVSTLTFTLNVPIFDGFRKHSLIKQATYEKAKIENELKNLREGAELGANTARIQIEQSLKNMETQKRNMELAQNVVSVAQTKLAQGIGSNIEIVNAQAELSRAQINYTSALLNAYIARVDYQKSIGTLYKK